ncbi:Uncharacterised protein [Leclercia adecarboxylata]|uniref:Uncharacterized protein n=1 Tax=Leclercia adecarboxylata TaxID=83655 RepID=A0A4U9IDX1_9ENTR|nr:Uncharacterised protein [Leclercia adecarboxylata]
MPQMLLFSAKIVLMVGLAKLSLILHLMIQFLGKQIKLSQRKCFEFFLVTFGRCTSCLAAQHHQKAITESATEIACLYFLEALIA